MHYMIADYGRKNYIPGHMLGHNAFASTVSLYDRTCANDTVLTQFALLLLSFSRIPNDLCQNFPS